LSVFGGKFRTCGLCVCVCVCVCVTTGWKAHRKAHTHTPQVQNFPPNTDHAYDKYLWTIPRYFSQSTGYHSLMMDPLWSETCWSNF